MALHSGGVKLGDRIVALVTKAIVATHSKLVHTKHKLAMLVFSDISDIISEEVHRTTGSILSQFHAELDPDSIAHPLLKFMAEEHGQLQALAGSFASASGILSSIAQVVNNELSPSVRGLLSSNPHLLPDPGTLAELAAAGIADQRDVVNSITEQGIDAGWANAMVEAQRQYPDVSVMLDMVRRGLIGRDNFLEWSVRNRIPLPIAQQMANLIDVPLSPADAALAVLRGNMSQADGAAVAAKWGVNAATFQTIIDNTGEPIALEQLLEAHRRGFIDDARLVKGILESRIRDEWVDVAKKLANVPMSTADAVQAVVQNHISEAEGEQIANWNGLEQGYFATLVETAGAPLSRTEMEQLYNRGQATKDDVLQALRESRLKDKYGEKAFLLHERLLDPGELADAVLWGVMDHQTAVQRAMEWGYPADSAQVLISSAVNRKMETQRMAVVHAIETLYQDNAVSREQAAQVIGKMGFDATEVELTLQAADFKRDAKLTTAGLNAVRAKFVAHHIDRVKASGLIDQMNIPHQQRDAFLEIWQVERDANVRLLTPSQVIKANSLGFYTDAETLTYLLNLGYDDKAANALIGGA